MREVVDLEEWQKNVEETYETVPTSCRPKKSVHKARSYEKRRALAISCKKAWDEWIDTGFLVVTDKGFKLCPEAMNQKQ